MRFAPTCKIVTSTGFLCGNGLPCPYHGGSAHATTATATAAVPMTREDKLVQAAKQAIPWLVLLGDYIGDGTEDDPEGRCAAIAALRDALGADALQNEMNEDGFFIDRDAREDKISRLPRERCVELLEGASIECGDDPVEVLRAAVLVNVTDGTLDDSDLDD